MNTEKKFIEIAKEKGLDDLEIQLAYETYKEICGSNWDSFTANEIICNYT